MGGLPRTGSVDVAEWGLSREWALSHPRVAEGFSGALRKLTQKSPSSFTATREAPVKVSVKQLLDLVGGGKLRWGGGGDRGREGAPLRAAQRRTAQRALAQCSTLCLRLGAPRVRVLRLGWSWPPGQQWPLRCSSDQQHQEDPDLLPLASRRFPRPQPLIHTTSLQSCRFRKSVSVELHNLQHLRWLCAHSIASSESFQLVMGSLFLRVTEPCPTT
uniref:Uncharacterized protein n=1 Tax=Rangifer tarandus platyrhynchus TaxID=3082113 RepID=A0ACB0E6B9_RANTA|nr:unnamed protein product [Rangifer tarandus platyrhynchus]